MSQQKRYLVQVPAQVSRRTRLRLEDVEAGMPSSQVLRSGTAGTRVLELDAAEALNLVRFHPGLLIEEDQQLELLGSMPSLGFRAEPGRGHEHSCRVVDAETEKPVSDVTVFLQGRHATYRGQTDDNGVATVTALEMTIDRVIVSPAARYWSRVVTPGALDADVPVALTPLAPTGASEWGRSGMGIAADSPFRGEGIRVALIDSGIAEHDDLSVVGGFNALDGDDSEDFLRDERGHGTHCAGVIGGRNANEGVLGVAPDAELYSIKVFPGGHLSDLLDGLQWAIDNDIDVINISLGVREPSLQVSMKLAEAAEHGIVIVAAAGNEANAPSFPASDEHVLAVTAFGQSRSFPADSAHTLRVGELYNAATGLFVANFCNVGPQTAFIAPGVGIVSSVPQGHAAWDGTSMASPFIAGLVAVLLSAYPELRTGDARQPVAVRQLLASCASDLDLPREVQGAGVPQASVALEPAMRRRAAAAQATALREQIGPLIEDLDGMRSKIAALLAQLD